MARTKKSESVPVRIRFKQLKDGNQSIYLDIYTDRKRRYEFLKLFLIPEVSQEAKERNANTLKAANAIKAQRILDITNKKPVTVLSDKARMPLVEWLDEYAEFGKKKGRSSLVDHVHAVNICLRAYNPRIRLHEVDKLLRIYTCRPQLCRGSGNPRRQSSAVIRLGFHTGRPHQA